MREGGAEPGDSSGLEESKKVNSGAGILLCIRRSNLASMALAPINQAGYHSEDMCHKPNAQNSRGAGIHCIL